MHYVRGRLGKVAASGERATVGPAVVSLRGAVLEEPAVGKQGDGV